MASTAPSTEPQAVITTTGKVASSAVQPPEQIQPLLARGGVARVVEVHQHGVELLALGGGQHARGRAGRDHLVTRVLQQQAQGLEHVGLIVGQQDAGGGHGGRLPHSSQPSFRWTIRLPWAAFFSEWVTWTIVVPCRLSS